jgi:hypothetical protein
MSANEDRPFQTVAEFKKPRAKSSPTARLSIILPDAPVRVNESRGRERVQIRGKDLLLGFGEKPLIVSDRHVSASVNGVDL